MIKISQTFLKNAKLSIAGDNRLLIVFKDGLSYEYFQREEHKEELRQLVSNQIQRQVNLEIRLLAEGRKFEQDYADIEQCIHMEVTIEDDEQEEF